MKTMHVPCDGCTICCQDFDLIRLVPARGDVMSAYAIKPVQKWGFCLQHKSNGDCIYLDREKGCTIHDRRPYMCRTMDCRQVAVMARETVAHPLPAHMRTDHMKKIIERGRQLIREGKVSDD